MKTLPEIADFIHDIAKELEAEEFVEPPKILNAISDIIERGEITESLIHSTFAKLQESLRNEFCDEQWKEPILTQTTQILDKGSPNFMQALRILKEINVPQKTCNQILALASAQMQDRTISNLMQAFRTVDETKAPRKTFNQILDQTIPQTVQDVVLIMMQLACFVYLIYTEGVYDNIMRFLYAIYKRRPARASNLKSVCDNLTKAKVGSALIDGYNPTVRNAIAHASFLLDTNSLTATFVDQRSNKCEKMSFDDFWLMVAKVLNVGIAVSTILWGRIIIAVAFNESIEVVTKNKSTAKLSASA